MSQPISVQDITQKRISSRFILLAQLFHPLVRVLALGILQFDDVAVAQSL